MTMSSTSDNEEDYFQLPRKVSINSMSVDDDNEDFASTTVLDTSTFINSGTNEDEVVRRKQEDAGMDNIQDDEACTIDDDDFLALLGIQTDSSNDTTATDCEDTKKLLKRVPSSSSCSEDDMEFENFLSLLDGMNDTDNSVSVDNMMDNNISMLENDHGDPTSVLSSIIPPRQLEEDFVISIMSDSNITSLSSLPSSPQSRMEKKETSTTRATRSNSIEYREQGTLKLRSGGSNKRLRVRSSMSSSVKRRFRTTTTTSTTDNITVPSSLSEQVDVGLSRVEKIMEPSQRRYTTRSQRGKVHPLKYN